MLETDIQMTKDGHIIAFHDLDGNRLLGNPEKISELTYDEV